MTPAQMYLLLGKSEERIRELESSLQAMETKLQLSCELNDAYEQGRQRLEESLEALEKRAQQAEQALLRFKNYISNAAMIVGNERAKLVTTEMSEKFALFLCKDLAGEALEGRVDTNSSIE